MNTFHALIITTDGTIETAEWAAGGTNLTHLQQAVGGSVDVVALTDELDMWVNDEGLVMGMPINEVATAIAREHGMSHQPYAGPAVFTGGCDEAGDTQPLTKDLERRLRRLAQA